MMDPGLEIGTIGAPGIEEDPDREIGTGTGTEIWIGICAEIKAEDPNL